MQPYVIGIDIGTGSVKAVAVDAGGSVLGSLRQEYTAGEDRQEQDVKEIFSVFLQGLISLIEAMKHPPVCVSLSSTMHSLLAVDAAGQPLTMASLWSDNRSQEVAEALRNSPTGTALYLATGTPIHAMSPLCKLKWMSAELPQLFQKAARFVSIKEWIWHRLFQEYRIDHSLASATGLFNIHQRQWDLDALAFAGLSAERLSEPVPCSYLKQGTDLKIDSLPGLADASFCIGASDGCLANIGSSCLDPSVAAITIGTSAAVRLTCRKPVPDVRRMFFNYLMEENYICGGPVNNGGNILQWLSGNFSTTGNGAMDYETMFAAIDAMAPGAGGLMFLPYINGERAPVWDEKSSGVFLGVKASHTQAHFFRAAVEGLCFALKEILEALEEACGPVREIRLSGGIVRSRVAVQLLADVLDRPVLLQQQEDASAVGAAYLGLKTLGFLSGFDALASSQTMAMQPGAERASIYRQVFPVYKSLYPQLKETLHLLYQFNLK